MRTLDGLIAHYAESHRDARNEAMHVVCVPAIVFAVIGIALGIAPWLAVLGIGAALLYYARLGPRPTAEMAAMLLVMLLIWEFAIPAHRIAVAALVFVLAWIGQFIGHAWEGRKPSFLEDVQYLLVGPLFVLAVLRRRLSPP